MTTTFVKIALRIRPLPANEDIKEECLKTTRNENKVYLGVDKCFDFDFLYPSHITEQDVYESSVGPLLSRFIEGNNITLLTYRQADMYSSSDDQGILHRLAHSLFDKMKGEAEYQIYASCLELCNEDVIDLLAPGNPFVKENNQGQIDWKGVVDERAYTANELLSCFERGHVTTRNNYLARSHHIFSVTIKHQVISKEKHTRTVSKFHVVNLASLEKVLKHSDLSVDPTQQNQNIPFNDSKLTRLLQDSLEQETLLLAYVSSLASNHKETLNTLRYTNQWRNKKANHEDVRCLYSELSQLKADMVVLSDTKNNHYLEEQVKLLKEEMSSIRSYVYSLTGELTKTKTEKDALEVQLSYSHELGSTETNYNQKPIKQKSSKHLGKDSFKRKRSSKVVSHVQKKHEPYIPTDDFMDSLGSESKDETVLHENLQLSLENFSFPSCQDISRFESEDQQMPVPLSPSSNSLLLEDEHETLEALAVPVWSDEGKENTVKRTSISTESLWEDTDSSISCMNSSTVGTPVLTPSNDYKGDRKQNKKLLRMLHQVQADSLVKRELVGRLEKTEGFYTQMRTDYEEKLNQLRLHLAEVQRERDAALKRRPMSPTASTPIRERPQSVLQLRENKQAEELRSEYQVKLKQLIAENHELQKRNTQITQASRTAQTKSDSIIRQLQGEIETLTMQKKRQSRNLKVESDNAKESAIYYEREIQQLKRRETSALEAKKKTEEANEAQSQLIKKRSEETAAANAQMRQLVNLLRKAANAGTFLNEANLEKILNGTFIPTPTNVPSRRSANT